MTPRPAVVYVCCAPDTLRELMLQAWREGLTRGDFAFFYIDIFGASLQGGGRFPDPQRPWKRGDRHDDSAREAFQVGGGRPPPHPDPHNPPHHHGAPPRVKQPRAHSHVRTPSPWRCPPPPPLPSPTPPSLRPPPARCWQLCWRKEATFISPGLGSSAACGY